MPGVTRPRRRHCDETKPVAEPGPLALLPVARSPSRPGHPEPLVGSYPTLSPLTRTCLRRPLAGLLSVAVVVTMPLPAWRPHLLFREATLPPEEVGSREVPLPARRPAAAALHGFPYVRVLSMCFNVGNYSTGRGDCQVVWAQKISCAMDNGIRRRATPRRYG